MQRKLELSFLCFLLVLAVTGSVRAQTAAIPQEQLATPQNPIAKSLPPHLQSMLPGGAQGPAARGYDGIVYEPRSHRLLMCLGEASATALMNGSSGLPGNGGVWAFHAGPNRWSVVSPSVPFASDGGIVYDESAGRLIAYVYLLPTLGSGHILAADFISETWAYDPATDTWENRHPAHTPPVGLGGGGAQLAYDARSGKTIMFGGLYFALFEQFLEGCAQGNCNNSLLPLLFSNHTWVYDYFANTWTDMTPAVSPPPRNSHALVYDTAADRTVLFGGGDFFVDYNDTWAYDYEHNTWTQLNPSTQPNSRSYGYMAYNSEEDRIVLFGGVDYTETQIYGDTWVFNYWEQTWTSLNPTESPSPRGWFGMSYSPTANVIVIFGGGTDRNHFTDETWIYRLGPNKWVQVAKP